MPERLAIEGGKPVRERPLRAGWPGAMMIGEEEKKAVLEVLENKSLFRFYGPKPLYKVAQFEKEFAKFMGVKHALAVTSGTAALNVSIAALEIGPGDEVIVPALTFIASADSVACQRAVPVFAEVDRSLGLDPEDVEKKITSRTKAIMPVHLQGVPCKMDELMEVAEEHGLMVIEDCAQAIGAKYKGRRVGSIGDVGAYSLQLNKLITCGDGGVVATNDDDVYEKAVRYHDHGFFRGREEGEPFIGQVYRMNELSGAVALEQLKKLDKIISLLRKVYDRVIDGIRDLDGITLREVPDPEGVAGVSICFFTSDSETAKRFVEALRAEGIPANILYGGKPVYSHPQILNQKTLNRVGCPWKCPLYKGKVKYRIGMCPKTEDLAKRAIFIPMSPLYTLEDADDIVAAVTKVEENITK
ncbi:DegT/DnrJ/EryC1/StrS family aminotransferase [Candidatus Bathyarchaeota archaeon]|nr:MAG: DegT/DnrJ/EryC1/StrS family aminotransferase [Candidatus Bathyarchaeota archaeon]